LEEKKIVFARFSITIANFIQIVLNKSLTFLILRRKVRDLFSLYPIRKSALPFWRGKKYIAKVGFSAIGGSAFGGQALHGLSNGVYLIQRSYGA
jgi:hypothetical protein